MLHYFPLSNTVTLLPQTIFSDNPVIFVTAGFTCKQV
jgi:hypothetical protein